MTGRVKDIDPCSLLLIAAPESGKTSVVLERPCKQVEAFTDITGRGLHKILEKNGAEITHLIFNDLVAAMSHKQSVNRYLVSQINALTEEGITKIATPAGVEAFTWGKKGVIASITLDLVKDARYWWNKVGFTSRMLPFCYFYPDELIIKIKDHIDNGTQPRVNYQPHAKKELAKQELKSPPAPITVEYPATIVKDVRWIADVRSRILKEQGMRRLKQYHSLVQGHAALRAKGKGKVEEEDLDFLKKIDRYVSYTEASPL